MLEIKRLFYLNYCYLGTYVPNKMLKQHEKLRKSI